ncbi:MAG: hypothetical protein IJM18_05570, partial [Clostridia bacterium]|nr:hypothetical protein [Clostridia bacterium]
IKDETMIGELRLLSSVEIADGFINFTLSDEALGSFTEDCAGYGEGELFPVIPAGDTPEYAHAALLGICLRPGEEGGAVPSDPEARKALWLCLSADSPASFNLAANKICAVLKKHRKTPVLTKRAARAMAASLRRNIIEYKKTE